MAELQGRELDAALARALGLKVVKTALDWDSGLNYYIDDVTVPYDVPVRFYHEDLNAMHDVEAELERRGLGEEYANRLAHGADADFASGYDHIIDMANYYKVAHATAEQKARAALAVLSAQEAR